MLRNPWYIDVSSDPNIIEHEITNNISSIYNKPLTISLILTL